MAGPIDPATLLSKTKAEGGLQAVGIPPEWADYAEILAGYTAKYGVPIDYKADAEYSSAQEVQVFQQSKIHPYGDVADVGFKWGPVVIQDGLVSPYKHSHWADIPAELKDPAGNWCTEYWGAQAFVVNTKLVKNVPTSFAELLSGSYPNQVGIDGDPRQATDALYAVYSAAAATSGSTSSIEPGIEYFANLKKKGNFTPARANEANIVQGEVPIAIIWDYLGLGYRDKYGTNPALQVIIPSDGALAGPYISIVNKTAPHPFAARAWIEYLFSDEGQLFYLKGYAHPARYQALSTAGKIPADLAAKLPSASEYANVKFVSDINALTQASTDLTNDWQSKVLGQ
jgi:putative spermidine/putrescine transport system substrate-binding protein